MLKRVTCQVFFWEITIYIRRSLMSNLDQIAKLSGFSKATVSRVLNHSPM